MKYAILTFGCKVNQYESEAIDNAMKTSGFVPCGSDDTPDVVIINSCTVTGNGDKKVLHAVRSARKQGSVTVLTGCYPQAFPESAASCGADIIAGSAHKTDIPGLIINYFSGEHTCADISLPRTFEYYDPVCSENKTRAFIKIEDGCDNYCSYCIIPYARGHVRSRSIASIENEAALCAAAGHKEIVLIGINLSRFGSDSGCDLADAVNAASLPDTVRRVRFSSLEPELLTDELIAKLARNSKLCPHFHLSLQSGCDETLRRMNRHYDSAAYLNIVNKLRQNFPGCAVTTDIMVGFSGETDDEFARSLAFAEQVGFSRIHVFTYSVRPGTAAEKFPGQVPDSIKNARYEKMFRLSQKMNSAFLQSHIGICTDILVQKRTSPDFAAGLTPDYVPVRIYGSDAQRHDILNVRITGTGDGYCIGEAL